MEMEKIGSGILDKQPGSATPKINGTICSKAYRYFLSSVEGAVQTIILVNVSDSGDLLPTRIRAFRTSQISEQWIQAL